MAEAAEGKKLVELRVIDLKTELERRGLDKTGNKAALLERLSKAITDDGGKPEEYLIVPSGGATKVTPRKNSVTGASGQEESNDGNTENRKDDTNSENQINSEMKVKEEIETSATCEDTPEVKKETNELQEEPEESKKETAIVKEEEAIEPKEEVKTEEAEVEEEEEVEDEGNNDSESIVKTEPTPPPAPPNPTVVETNGIDNEDSINLTIGEDEENLLAEEGEGSKSSGSNSLDSTVKKIMKVKLISDEHLIHLNEANEDGLFHNVEDSKDRKKKTTSNEDSTYQEDPDYEPPEKKTREIEHISLEEKIKVVRIAREHPNWSLRTLKSRGCRRLTRKDELKKWEQHIKTGGTIIDKYAAIDSWTYDRFVEARQNFEQTETHERRKDGGEKRTEENKKGDSKGSGRAEGAANKEGANGLKNNNNNNNNNNKQDGGEGSKSSDSAAKGQKRDDKDKKASPISTANASSRNLWVSGLSSTTRATDLKQVFSKYGKVIGAKVVTNARTPGARCYGYVTMSTSEDAAKCIQHLHRTELHGRVISVEKAKGDSQQSHMRKRDSNSVKSDKKDEKDKSGKENSETSEKKDKDPKKEAEEKAAEPSTAKKPEEKSDAADEKRPETTEKKDEAAKDSDARSTKSTSKKPESDRGKRTSDKRVRSWEHHRSHTRSRSRERRRRDDVLTFDKIREERERQRLRERERMLREEERRRREDMERQREIERRQREEAARLEREREKLRRERERIEQEKAELLRLERERQKLEREKLERERIELKRQQMRLEESRRPPPPPSIKRTSSDRRDPRDLYQEPERKRIASEHSRRHSPERVSDRRTDILERVSDRRLDPSPPSRYESNSRSTQDIGLKKDFKRSSDFPSRSSSRPDVFPEVTRGREVIVRREPITAQSSSIDPRQVKESRYERTASSTYGRDREVRRSDTTDSHRSTRDGHTRYTESTKPPGSTATRDSRYTESSRSTGGWHAGPPSVKSFNSVTSGGPRDPRNEISGWSSRSSDNVNRWGSSGSIGSTMRHPGPPLYQGGGGPMPSMSLAPPGTGPSYDRFDPYKPSMPSMRKY